MSFLESLIAWANVPFTMALGTALGFAALQVSGIMGLIAGGSDDSDADGHAEGDAEAHADHEADVDHDHDVDADPHGADGFLAFLGVGKVPLSIIWQSFAVSFGFAGIAVNTIYLETVGGLPTYTLLWAVPAAFVVGSGATRLLGRGVARLLTDPRQQATTRKELVGQTGVVISSKVDRTFGEVKIPDKTGLVVRVICRIAEGER